MTRETLESLVLEATGRSDKLDLIRSAINIAVSEISKQRLWLDLQTEGEEMTTAGVTYVPLATDVSRLVEVRLLKGQNSRVLLLKQKSWLMERFPLVDVIPSGEPVYGYLESSLLFMIPIPNDVYPIRYTYYRLHPPLELPTSTLLFPHLGPAVAAYASFWVFQVLEKSTDAQRWYQTYLALLDSAKRVDASNSAVIHKAQPRGSVPSGVIEYWMDPFVRRNP